ncbi:carbohydrate kinase family protein [Lawsonia intracellularis]|uniref:Sugar kinases, ribokinase family n=1 Tax=Lawsonia intracellularis (strain PHE/MN1-00) TaxID=363253 RepID=Q1MQ93_LAWIP|nr:carbohydrate kinase family protein [Lawsonia intracellularis]AGC50201.1 pfkB family carbohydrate kinase [Lawsonia intracellularis N343]KAA0204628.1 carbohydrate kinase family protein [Lawsonia intracellularis]MBZ3892642.1 carbohydrate kinase family protein [Lawsonia intracellularis]OMQ03103.1 carbohydrate kinase family protein [Lawsonia intracellularis]RBN33191.1 carbohydrate kinase family protein [Lawsonia intracellularis]
MIYIAGSLAYDKIMNFPGKFEEHILADKLHVLNVCFLINGLIEKRGGTAGNIAYTLSLMNEKSYILSSVGTDFENYEKFLSSLKLPLDGIRKIPDTLTAVAYITTDQSNNQITGFYPAAMNFPCLYDLPQLNKMHDWAIISPTNIEDMQKLPTIFYEKQIKYIFDPGQQLPVLSKDDLLNAITGSSILVTNDYEFEMICKKTDKTRAELRSLTGAIITTLGDQGALIHTDKEISIGIAVPNKIMDPTGAGDAFRAGLLKGLIHNLDIVESAYLGSTAASFCIENSGTQEHTFTYTTFSERYKKAFNEYPTLSW